MKALAARLNYGWRVIATGLSFALFGIGGILLSLTLFPLARLLSANSDTTRRRTQFIMHASWRVFIGFMKYAGILSWELRGGERLRQPGRLIVCNHPSLLDVVFMISFMPRVDCIVKTAILRNPFMRWPAAWAGYVASDDPEALVEACAQRLRMGHSLLVFPEGTRSRPAELIHLKRGAAQIALAANAEVLPVTLTVVPTTLTKGRLWYHIPPRRFHVTVSVGEALRPADFQPQGTSRTLAARRLTGHLERHFTAQVAQLTAEQAANRRSRKLLAL
ncbi:MAG: lysophospholipid acyltransferase family protein [Stenotrophobium sp.]